MGLYDQFLGLTQQGLDTGTQIAMQRAQQPTMADVFMDRFRAGGQDQMARQKMAEDARMNEARLRDMQANRQFQAMHGASNYATDETAPAWESLQRSAGVETPVGGPGLKQKQLEQALAMLQEKLEAQKGVAGQADATKRYGIDVAANKPATPVARINAALQRGQLSPEEAEAERRKATHIAPPSVYGTPMAVLDSEGNPALIQPNKQGGVKRVEEYKPTPKSGSGAGNRQAIDAASNDVNDLVKKIDEALAHPGLGSTVGITGRVKRIIPASSAAVASGLVDSIKSQSGLQRIAELKKSGAGLGSVTEAEHTLVQNAGNSLDLDKMDEKTLRSNLAELKRKALRLSKSLKTATSDKAQTDGQKAMSLDEYLASQEKK